MDKDVAKRIRFNNERGWIEWELYGLIITITVMISLTIAIGTLFHYEENRTQQIAAMYLAQGELNTMEAELKDNVITQGTYQRDRVLKDHKFKVTDRITTQSSDTGCCYRCQVEVDWEYGKHKQKITAERTINLR